MWMSQVLCLLTPQIFNALKIEMENWGLPKKEFPTMEEILKMSKGGNVQVGLCEIVEGGGG